MKLKNPSDYVTANIDIKTGDIVQFLNEGAYTNPPQNPEREVLTFKVLLPNGEEKKISVNKTSQKELMSAWCPDDMDSSHWVGKRAKVKIVNQKVFNEFKDVIYLTPLIEAPIPVVEDEPKEVEPDPEPEE